MEDGREGGREGGFQQGRRREEGTVILLVSATIKKPPSGIIGCRPAVVNASMSRVLCGRRE